MTHPFCALCTEACDGTVQRPLGRDDAMVNVCHRCDEEHPRSGGYSFGADGRQYGGEVRLSARMSGGSSTRRDRVRR